MVVVDPGPQGLFESSRPAQPSGLRADGDGQTNVFHSVDRDPAGQGRDDLVGDLTKHGNEDGDALRAQKSIDHRAEPPVLVAVH